MKRIGEILVENGWVPAPVLARALAKQREIPRRLCSLLIAGGVLEVDQASRALGEQLGVAAVLQKHLDHRDRSLAALIPAELARAWWVLPIGRLGNGDLIVCARDPRPSVLAALQAVLTDTIVLAVAPASQIEMLVADTYGAAEEDFDVDMNTGPIASLDLEPMGDEADPMGDLGNLELVELDDAGVTRDPNQSGMVQVGAQRHTTLPPSSVGIRIPQTLAPATAPRAEPIPLPRPTLPPVNVAPSRPTPPPVNVAPSRPTPPLPAVPRPELVVIDPPTRPPVKRAPTEPAMIVDRPPSAAALAEDAARPAGKTAAEQAAELATQLPAEPAGAARLLARPEAASPPPAVVIRPRRQTVPPPPIAAVDDGWESPDVDARPPRTTTVPPPLPMPEPEPTPASAAAPLPRLTKPAPDDAARPLKKPPPVHAVTRPPTIDAPRTPTPTPPLGLTRPPAPLADDARTPTKPSVAEQRADAGPTRPPAPMRAPTQPPPAAERRADASAPRSATVTRLPTAPPPMAEQRAESGAARPSTPARAPTQPPPAAEQRADASAPRSAPVTRLPTAPPPMAEQRAESGAARPSAPARAPTQPPAGRIDPDVIAAAYAVPPPAYDPQAIAAGTVRPQRKMLSLPANLPDTLTALGAVTTRDAATAAAMRFAQGRWRTALLLRVKEKSALGEAGHGNLLGEDVVAGLAIPLAAPSIVTLALEARALTTELPRDDSPVQDRLDRLLGMPRFPAAAPIMLAGYAAFVFVIGDPIADDTDAATNDLERLASALSAAYARVTPG